MVVRNIAYRMYLYTDNPDELTNWFLSERLLDSNVWVQNITAMAAILSTDAGSTVSHMRSDMIRSFYSTQTF